MWHYFFFLIPVENALYSFFSSNKYMCSLKNNPDDTANYEPRTSGRRNRGLKANGITYEVWIPTCATV